MSLDPTNWKSPASIIANVIDAKLSQLTLGTNLFVGFMPDSPHDCVCIIDTGGGEQDPINAIDDVSFQVYSRSSSYPAGYNLQNLIKSEIQSIPATTVDSEKILGIWTKSNIASIGRDEQERSLFSSNYRAKIETTKNINRN